MVKENKMFSKNRNKKVYNRVLNQGIFIKKINKWSFYNDNGTVYKLTENEIMEAASETVYVCLDCKIELTQDNAHLEDTCFEHKIICDKCKKDSVSFYYYS